MIEVYYAEDDEVIGKSVKEYLEQQNCKVAVFPAIADIRQALVNHLPTIILLDWNMPDGQGNELCSWIRERWNDLPVIYLTVRGDPHDIVTGFQNGADDYVVKPFDLAVLHSRILALLRRTKSANGTKLFCDDLMLDKEKSAVYYQQKEISVSKVTHLLSEQTTGAEVYISANDAGSYVWIDGNGTEYQNNGDGTFTDYYGNDYDLVY